MNIFFSSEATLHNHCTLPEAEVQHLHVLRKNTGDTIHVFDGSGKLYLSEIVSLSRKEAIVSNQKLLRHDPRKQSLHIAIAPPKNMERFEWFLEKATELGVETVTPLLCEHSERKELRVERLQKIILAAAKQSMNLYLPVLNSMTAFKSFVKAQSSGQLFIAHASETQPHFKAALNVEQDAVIIIGPEGDFSEKEIELANASGFKTVHLGKTRLRLETAGIFAAAVFKLLNDKD